MDDAPAPTASPIAAAIRVLASGSAGNCTVLLLRVMGQRRICLIDAGLSPRRTRRLIEEAGLSMDQLDSVLLTHLDHDHWHSGWVAGLPKHAKLRLHRKHAAIARREGALPERSEAFDEPFDLFPGVRVTSAVGSHDAQGVATFRFEFACPQGSASAASLGFATDVGRITDDLIDHLHGVDVLAIESNYCPSLQQASARPAFLKRRIMGGSGHLSNEQSLRAIGQIGPPAHVVLLHLSRQCNHPDLVADIHAGAPYTVTITEQTRASRWVPIQASPTRPAPRRPKTPRADQLPLFGLGPALSKVAATAAGGHTL